MGFLNMIPGVFGDVNVYYSVAQTNRSAASKIIKN